MTRPIKNIMIMLLISLLMLSAGAGMAQAATRNSVNRVVSVGDDYRGYLRTDLTIIEEEAFPNGIQAGQTFELLLPMGVEWIRDSNGTATYESEDIICQNCSVEAELRNARTVEITVTAADPESVSQLEIPLVFAVNDFLGDIEVTIDSLDSTISGGQYLFAQVPYKLVPVPEPEPDPQPQPVQQQQAVFTIVQ